MKKPRVVTPEAWLEARKALLEKEKAFTRARDALTRERQQLPWTRVDKDYVFDGPGGRETLADLFDGRSQLIVYHFMYGPDWDAGCESCSFWADSYDANVVHLAHRDITLVAVSRAPWATLDAYRRRMGWRFKWVSSADSDFNFDYHVSFRPAHEQAGGYYNYQPGGFSGEEAPGLSVFWKGDDGQVFHTYSCYARGLDMMNAAYQHMDLTPLGRDEDDLEYPMAWVRRRDEYPD